MTPDKRRNFYVQPSARLRWTDVRRCVCVVAHSERGRYAGPSTARRSPTRDFSRRAFDKGNVYGMAANAETDHLALEIG
jgi:hypothetical protein